MCSVIGGAFAGFCLAFTSPAIAKPFDPDDTAGVRQLQIALCDLGYLAESHGLCEIDGKLGPNTREAAMTVCHETDLDCSEVTYELWWKLEEIVSNLDSPVLAVAYRLLRADSPGQCGATSYCFRAFPVVSKSRHDATTKALLQCREATKGKKLFRGDAGCGVVRAEMVGIAICTTDNGRAFQIFKWGGKEDYENVPSKARACDIVFLASAKDELSVGAKE